MKSQIKYRIECQPEHISIEGNASAIDPVTDAEIVAEIYRQLEAGNEWAWCTVKVTAYIPGTDLEESDYLGGCSYKSQRDFERSGYFADMKLQAKTFLLQKLDAIKAIEVEAE
jgi:hypothetical protein